MNKYTITALCTLGVSNNNNIQRAVMITKYCCSFVIRAIAVQTHKWGKFTCLAKAKQQRKRVWRANTTKRQRKRKRKPAALAPPPMKSRKVARAETTQFHELTHELERLQKLEKQGSQEGKKARRIRQRRIAEIETKLQEAGGRQRYQDASKVSTRHNRTVKYVCSVLTSLKLRPGKGEGS